MGRIICTIFDFNFVVRIYIDMYIHINIKDTRQLDYKLIIDLIENQIIKELHPLSNQVRYRFDFVDKLIDL